MISSKISLHSKKNQLSFFFTRQTHSGGTVVQLQRLRLSRATTIESNDLPEQQLSNEHAAGKGVSWTEGGGLNTDRPPSSVTPRWLLTWFTSWHLQSPDQQSVKYARRLNIFPSSLQVHKHVLPKWKAIMLNHQLIISSSIYSTT